MPVKRRPYRSIKGRIPSHRRGEMIFDDMTRLLDGFTEGATGFDFLLDVAGTLSHAKAFIENAADDDIDLSSLYHDLSRRLDQVFSSGDIPPCLAEAMKKHALNPQDCHIILALSAANLGLGRRICDIEDLQNTMCLSNQDKIELAKRLMPDGPLASSHMVDIDYNRGTFNGSSIQIANNFIAPFLHGQGKFAEVWDVANQEELLDRLPVLRSSLQGCADNLDESESNIHIPTSEARALDRLINLFDSFFSSVCIYVSFHVSLNCFSNNCKFHKESINGKEKVDNICGRCNNCDTCTRYRELQ